MTDEAMLEEIAGFLHGYLKSGKVNIQSFFSKVNINIDNIRQLLIIRFLLKKETKDFVRSLPVLMKNVKTTTVAKSRLHINEIRGSIDWPQTVVERINTNPKDKTIFFTVETTRSYNTPENIVLKELLRVLYHHLFVDDYVKELENRNWFQDWKELKKNVSDAFNKNIYIQRVVQIIPSDRVIENTLNHRSSLYRNAANLLSFYRKLLNGQYSKEDLETLLSETFIAPENKDVLFELYWVVQLIKQNTAKSQLYILDGTQNLVASWETDEYIMKLYHDSTGSQKFTIYLDEIFSETNLYLKQKYRSHVMYKEIASKLFNKKVDDIIWQGRPDILLEVYDRNSGKLKKLFIGEVKNTKDINYALQGLKELVDYIHFVKDRKGDYLKQEIDIKGFLCLRDVPLNIKLQFNHIKIINFLQVNQLQILG